MEISGEHNKEMPFRCEKLERPRSLDLLAGTLAGATATLATYPLDVLQTRLQSSKFSMKKLLRLPMFAYAQNNQTVGLNVRNSQFLTPIRSSNLFTYTKIMIRDEGYSFFSRGLATSVVAISLSKGIYFPLYSSCKNFLRRKRDDGCRESTYVHVLSATFAGFISCTLTNPIWFLQTRLKLDSGKNGQNRFRLRMPVAIYKSEGLLVFYRGLTASYLGISETVLYFTIYEHLRRIFIEQRQSKQLQSSCKGRFHVSDYVIAAAVSKTIATIIAYPHEVFRTRMRERENIDKSFFEVIRIIWKNSRWQGFYGGLGTHLIRQVPNTAIVFLTYEAIVHFGEEFMMTNSRFIQ